LAKAKICQAKVTKILSQNFYHRFSKLNMKFGQIWEVLKEKTNGNKERALEPIYNSHKAKPH
jgi:hypothetical protein